MFPLVLTKWEAAGFVTGRRPLPSPPLGVRSAEEVLRGSARAADRPPNVGLGCPTNYLRRSRVSRSRSDARKQPDGKSLPVLLLELRWARSQPRRLASSCLWRIQRRRRCSMATF